MTELRPLELGAIVDRAATLWRGSWRRLYGLFFAFSLLQYALLKGAVLAMRHFAPLASGGAKAIAAMKDDIVEVLKQEGIAGSTFAVMFVIVLFVALVETSAATRYLMPTLLGQSARPLDGVTFTLKRLPMLLRLFGLAMGWSLVVLLCFLAPALVLGSVGALLDNATVKILLFSIGFLVAVPGVIVWFLWFFIRFAIWGQVAAMEDIGALVAFRRCGQLTSGRVGPGFFGFVKVRLTVLATVIVLLLMMISLVSGAPSLILQAVYGNLFDPMHADPNAVPQILLVPAELLNVAVQAIVAPLYVALQVVFYVDMRTRREGLDLELKIAEGGAKP